MSKKAKESKALLELKKKIVETCRAVLSEGLTGKRAGNISARVPGQDLMIITPSHYGHNKSQTGDLLVVDFSGKIVSGQRNPSSENRMHLAIYKARPDIGAVIHTHSIYASVLACNHMGIPPFIDEMIPFLGGPIECAQYGMPGSDELAENAVKGLGEKSAVLLANHGVLCTGKNLEKALESNEIVEHIAKVYVTALSIGKPTSLPADAIELQSSAYEFLRGSD